jgi:hypothetical protein
MSPSAEISREFNSVEFLKTNKSLYGVITFLYGFFLTIFFKFSGDIPKFAGLLILAFIVYLLIKMFYEAVNYQNFQIPSTDKNTNEYFKFTLFQGTLIIGLTACVIIPDKNGLTYLPSLVLFLAILLVMDILSNDKINDKNNLVNWIFLVYVLSLEFFLIFLSAIQFFVEINLNPVIYYWAAILLFTFFFACSGGLIAYLIMCFIAPRSMNKIQFCRYLYKENLLKAGIRLSITAGLTLLLTMILIPIFLPIVFPF